jgi:LacI family transcriptional regulator
MANRSKTLKDLAAKLDISVATASRALAGYDRIAVKTRERVAEAAREIGYVPNRAARALVSGRSGFVGLALPVRGYGQEDAFLDEFVAGLASGFGRLGVDLFLTAVPEGKSELAVIQNVVEARRADGLVLARVEEEDARIDYLIEHGFPFVAHGRIIDTKCTYSWFDTDGRTAFSEAFELLYALGHRHFALVTISEPMTFRRERSDGLAGAIARCGDPEIRIDTVASPRFDREARSADIRRLLEPADRPTAIIGLFDGIAISVMQEAAGLGLSIPADLSVVGFGNTPVARHAMPGLTTFDAAVYDAAEEIAAMLTRAIAAPDDLPQTCLRHAPLVPRGSHGPSPRR